MKAFIVIDRMIHFSSNSDTKKKVWTLKAHFLLTTLQIWCYFGHSIKSRTMKQ